MAQNLCEQAPVLLLIAHVVIEIIAHYVLRHVRRDRHGQGR